MASEKAKPSAKGITLYCTKCGSTNISKNGKREGKGKQRFRCKDCGNRSRPVTEKPELKYEPPIHVPKSDRYLVTCAVNATPPHKGLLKAFEGYCKRNNAKLLIIPIRYKNPTSVFTDEDHDWWHESLLPYISAGRGYLNRNLMYMGDVPVQPTMTRPLTGLESMTRWQSGIFGSPKLEFRVVPTPNQMLPKIITTTGAITMKNYTLSKAGKKGEFHHTFGACVVEIEDDELFHIRQVNAMEDGSFIDLDREYLPTGKSRKARPAEALSMGDTHVHWACESVDDATFWNEDSIVNTLRPKYLIWNDVLDQYARGHHDLKDPFIMYGKDQVGLGDVEAEVMDAIEFVMARTKRWQESVLVPSNHTEHLNRWIMETDWRKDPKNALFYLKTAAAMLEETVYDHENGGVRTPDAFVYWFEKMHPEFFSKYIHAPDRDDSFMVCGIECNLHGDMGPNGARGSIANLARIGVKVNIGHSHTPGIREGAFQAGTSSMLKLQYTKGPSSWMNTHIVTYANGKRCLINIIRGKWRKI